MELKNCLYFKFAEMGNSASQIFISQKFSYLKIPHLNFLSQKILCFKFHIQKFHTSNFLYLKILVHIFLPNNYKIPNNPKPQIIPNLKKFSNQLQNLPQKLPALANFSIFVTHKQTGAFLPWFLIPCIRPYTILYCWRLHVADANFPQLNGIRGLKSTKQSISEKEAEISERTQYIPRGPQWIIHFFCLIWGHWPFVLTQINYLILGLNASANVENSGIETLKQCQRENRHLLGVNWKQRMWKVHG
jgi:hypothetical protein